MKTPYVNRERVLEYSYSRLEEGKSQVQSFNEITQDNYSTIANRTKTVNPIDNRTIDYRSNSAKDVDQLLIDCKDLIDARYTQFFAKRFYKLNRDRVLALASQARQDARTSPQRLFSYLINKEV